MARPAPVSEPNFVAWIVLVLIIASAAAWGVRNIGVARHDKREPPRLVPEPQEPAPPRPVLRDPPPAVVRYEPPPTAVFRCATPSGGVSFGDSAACTGSLTVLRPEGTSTIGTSGLTDYQREMLRSADERIARNEAAARSGLVEAPAALSASRAECAALAVELQAIDARARQPHSSYEQDALRIRRQAITSRQFAAHC